MKTLTELKEHMEKFKDALVILGPDAAKMSGTKPYDPKDCFENMTRKKLSREPEEFWNFFDNFYYNDLSQLSLTRSQLAAIDLYKAGLAGDIVSLTTEGLLLDHIDAGHVIELHGNMDIFVCKKCKTLFTYGAIYKDHKCVHCGSAVRPDVQLIGEKYDDKLYNEFADLVDKTHTIITIGLDYTESSVNYLLEQFCDKKSLNHGEEAFVFVGIHNTDLNPNEIVGRHEFLVKDDCDAASKRFADGLSL